jgi:hypothetical protein
VEKNLTGTLLFSRNGYLTAMGCLRSALAEKKVTGEGVQGMLWCEFLYRDTVDSTPVCPSEPRVDSHIIVDPTRTGRRLSSRTRADYYLSALLRVG